MSIRTFFLICFFISAAAYTQEERPTIRPMRVDSPPRIDGILDEPLWQTIEPITDFRQWEPDVGEPVTERTEVRICYDSRYLYFGVRAHDREPEKIIANIFERDDNVWYDDSIAICIDSLRDLRTAYEFLTNAVGTQTDGELAEGGIWNGSWDAIWYSRSSVDQDGYSVEIAIPLFALRFKPAEEVEMGILLVRIIRRKNETAYWPELGRDHFHYNMNMYAGMAGLRGIERGVNVEVKPYAIAGHTRTPEESRYDADAGLDVKWGITPNLTTDFTFNTDFAHVESDALQFNLTRFSLFYPEKRDFFLESQDLFQFGLPSAAEVFFSRRIGIRASEEVPVLGGARLYGLVGNTNVGLLTLQTRESGGVSGENFTVARVKQNILGRSYLGGILTNRSGYDPGSDRTVGFDFRLLHGANAGISGAVARSGRPGVDDGNWFGTLSYFNTTDRFEASVRYLDIGPRFDPGIGFIQRRDQRTINLHGAYKPRPGWTGVRQLFFYGDYNRTYNYGGDIESVLASGQFDVKFQSEDLASVVVKWEEDLVPFAFEIAPGVLIPPGRYSFLQAWPGFELSTARRVSLFGGFAGGGFYGGNLTVGGLGFHIKFTPRFQVGGEVEVSDVDLPGGSFTSAISRIDLSYYFSPLLTTRLATQYSSLFEEFVFNFRLRWIYAPGSEAWLVYDEGRRFGLPGSSLRDRALVFKIVHNFNF